MRSANYRPMYKWFFWVLVVDVVVLGYLGQAEATPTVVLLSQICAAYYFAHFLIILPIVSRIERPLPLPYSISESVLHGEKPPKPRRSARRPPDQGSLTRPCSASSPR